MGSDRVSLMSSQRYYEVWPGQNTPCCNGRCLRGPDAGTFLCNISLISVNAVLFFVFVAWKIHVAVLVVGLLLLASTFAMLFSAAFVEAGIIPRAPKSVTQVPPPGPAPTTKIDGQDVPLKLCMTCNLYRPPRSKHCRDCDVCVEQFDHHCPWVCNCVGKRNYRFFVGFLITLTIFILYVFFWSFFLVIDDAVNSSFLESLSNNVVATIEVIVSFAFAWCICSLCTYHCYLIAQNITTAEHLKEVGVVDTEHSLCENCCNVFCTPLPPSRINLRQPVHEMEFNSTQLSEIV